MSYSISIAALAVVMLAALVTALAGRTGGARVTGVAVLIAVPLVLAPLAALAGHWVSAAALAAGASAMTWLAVMAAFRPRAAAVPGYPDAVEQRRGLSGRTFTVERVTSRTAGADAVPFAWGRLGVVQRQDGRFVAVRAVARPEESAAAMESLARALAAREDVAFGGAR